MRRITFVTTVLATILTLTGCSGNTAELENRIANLESRVEALEQADTTPKDASSEEVTTEDTVTIGDATFDNESYGDSRVIIVPMTFTNNNSQASTFVESCKVSIYQDGAALNTGVPASWASGLPQTWEDRITQIQPGVTINIASAYTLRSTSPVTVEVRSMQSDKVIAEKTFNVS